MEPHIITRYRFMEPENKRKVAIYLHDHLKISGLSCRVAETSGEGQSITEDGLAFTFDFDTGPIYLFTATMGNQDIESNIVAYIEVDDPYKVVVKDFSILSIVKDVLNGYVDENNQVLVEFQIGKS